MTETTKDAIVDRFTRGQTMAFIGFALDVSLAKVRAVLVERGVEIRRSSERNRAWGYTGRA
jgi:hypothetical protein